MDVFAHNELSSVFDQVPLVVYRCLQQGIDRKFDFVSPYIYSLLGVTSEHLLNDPKAFFRRIHPEDRNMFLRAWENHSHMPATIRLDYRMLGEGNRVVWIHDNSVMSQGESGS